MHWIIFDNISNNVLNLDSFREMLRHIGDLKEKQRSYPYALIVQKHYEKTSPKQMVN